MRGDTIGWKCGLFGQGLAGKLVIEYPCAGTIDFCAFKRGEAALFITLM
jgi:hypothetical protein